MDYKYIFDALEKILRDNAYTLEWQSKRIDELQARIKELERELEEAKF